MSFRDVRIPYIEHFGLRDEPYSPSPNPRYLYLSPTHDLAREKTRWSIAAKRGLSLCFGAVGTGKTTLARELAQRMEDDPDIACVFVTNPNFPTPNQLLRAVAQGFEVRRTSKNFLNLRGIFEEFLHREALDNGKTLVLIVDEAQRLRGPHLELLRRLLDGESTGQKFLQVALFAQEELRQRLHSPGLRNFAAHSAVSSTLETLSHAETNAMLRHRWLVAGGGEFPFNAGAVERLYAHSRGVPRTQVILADRALLAAYLAGGRTIGPDVIAHVVADRGLPDTEPVPAPAAPAVRRRTDGNVAAVRRRG